MVCNEKLQIIIQPIGLIGIITISMIIKVDLIIIIIVTIILIFRHDLSKNYISNVAIKLEIIFQASFK